MPLSFTRSLAVEIAKHRDRVKTSGAVVKQLFSEFLSTASVEAELAYRVARYEHLELKNELKTMEEVEKRYSAQRTAVKTEQLTEQSNDNKSIHDNGQIV